MADQDTATFLKTTSLFSALDEETLHFLAPKMESISLQNEQVLMEAGDPANCLYIIEQGKLDIYIQNEKQQEILVASRYSGESVGEIALLTGENRSAKACSNGSTELLSLSKPHLDLLETENPAAFKKIIQAIVHEFQRTLIQQILRASNLFENLTEDILSDLESELGVEMLKSGDYLIHEGDDSDSLHFIISGRVQISSVQKNGKLRIWDELGRGQSVSEMGILTGNKRSASVIALRDTVVAKLSEDSFFRLMVKHPRLITRQFAGNLINRLWRQLDNSGRSNTLSCFTVVPANSDYKLDDFCHNLTASLAQYGSVLYLNSERVNNILGRGDAAQTPYEDAYNIRLVQWLSEQEINHRYIIYQTDDTATNWTERCFRQADRVLILSPAKSTPKIGEACATLNQFNQNIDKTLVLLHDQDSTSPSNTQIWLNKTAPNTHIHIHHDDCNRLARILTGHNIGVVLSGGGARGFAHIGALRALEESGLAIDQIGGTSMGALCGDPGDPL